MNSSEFANVLVISIDLDVLRSISSIISIVSSLDSISGENTAD